MKPNALGRWYDHDHKKARKEFQRRLMWASVRRYFNNRWMPRALWQVAALPVALAVIEAAAHV